MHCPNYIGVGYMNFYSSFQSIHSFYIAPKFNCIPLTSKNRSRIEIVKGLVCWFYDKNMFVVCTLYNWRESNDLLMQCCKWVKAPSGAMNLTVTWISSWTLFHPFLYGCKCDAWVQVYLSWTVPHWKWSYAISHTSYLRTMWAVVTFVSLWVAVTFVTTAFVFGTMVKVISPKISHKLSRCIVPSF